MCSIIQGIEMSTPTEKKAMPYDGRLIKSALELFEWCKIRRENMTGEVKLQHYYLNDVVSVDFKLETLMIHDFICIEAQDGEEARAMYAIFAYLMDPLNYEALSSLKHRNELELTVRPSAWSDKRRGPAGPAFFALIDNVITTFVVTLDFLAKKLNM